MKMNEAIEKYKKLTYDLAKCVGQISEIKDQMDYINTEMGWDGMFIIDFEKAMEQLAKVQSSAILYSFEDEYRKDDIEKYKSMVKALENE